MLGKNGNSSIRDRTQEFFVISNRVKELFPRQNGASSSGSKPEELLRSSMSVHSDFNRRASKIGLGIHQTSQKLSRLAKLAKRTSVFDDPSIEIQELTAVIKQDITSLNAAVIDLQVFCNSSNGNGNISPETTTHSSTVIDDLKNRLMGATKEFKDVLTMRTENLKVHENRRQLYSSSVLKNPTNPFIRQRPLSKSSSNSANSPPPWANAEISSTPFSSKNEVEGDSQPLIHRQNQQQQISIPLQESYMQSRANALQNVESTIQELGSIFNQLANLVSQQGELAIRIDENMDDTLANVEGAQGSLLKYLNSISSNRWLMMKIFFVLVFFLMIFLFFVA